MSSHTSYVFHIDTNDRIIFTNKEWDIFAEENDAPEVVRKNVIGRSIWSFISGQTVRSLYEALFDRVRVEGVTLTIPFRCDSPDTMRRMELVINPLERGVLELEGRLLSSVPTQHISLFNRFARRSDESIRICSFCRRIEASGNWLEASDAIIRYNFFQADTQPTLVEDVCLSCSRRRI